MKKLISMILALCLSLGTVSVLSGCGRPTAYTATYFDAFDTVLNLTVAAKSPEEAQSISGEIHELVLELHRTLDIYHTYDGMTNLKTLNDRAGDGTPVPLSEDAMKVLSLGQETYDQTNGKVNIAMGAVLRLWHDARTRQTAPPSEQALADASAHCAMESLVLDQTAGTAMLTDPEASVDVGAIAKGYVASCVQAYAEERGIQSLLFDLGGHVLAIGNHPDGKAWRVGIRNPNGGELYTALEVSDASVVTSGSDQRFYEYEGKIYHHLIDPLTQMPASYHASVTVVIPLSHTAISDGLSTALFLMSEADGDRLLASHLPDAPCYRIPIS